MESKIEDSKSNSGTLVPDSASGTGTSTPLPFDLEKSSSQNLNPSDGGYVRPISNLSWTFVCVGLFLGALLYGTSPLLRCLQIVINIL